MSTLALQVSATTDDARNINGATSKTTNATTQHIGKFDATTDYWNGFRWLNVTIPQGATISSAILDLYSAQVTAGTTAKSIWYGVLEVNTATFNTSTSYPEGKTRTTATVTKDFTVSTWNATAGFGVDTFDVASLVQEIVNQASWASGNALALVAHDNGSASTNYIGHSTYDRATDRGAKLTITYTTGGGGVTVTPGVASIATTKFAPSVSVSDNKAVTPGVAALTTSSFVPTILTPRTVTPGTAPLTVTGFAPQSNLGVIPDTAALALNTFAPDVETTLNVLVTPDVASLSISTLSPMTILGTIITPGTVDLSTATFAPDVSVSQGTHVIPGTASLTLSTFVPSVSHSVPARKYYIDTDGEVYWLLNESIGLIEKI